jgi:ComF family protein
MASAFLNSWDRADFDLIVPAPLHPRRARERGFNQAAALARPIARLLGIPYDEAVLCRVRETLPQVGLSDVERVLNLRGAFRAVKTTAIEGRRVLLVDDVMTTGATVASATRALVKGGALRVCVLTLARTVRGLAG